MWSDGSDEETVDLVLDLDGDTTLVGHDDGNTSVKSLGDLDLETLTGGELEDDVRIGNDGVEKLIIGVQTHDANVLDEMGVVVLNLVHSLVINDAAIRIINGTVSTAREVSTCRYQWMKDDLHDELRNVSDTSLVSTATELSISINDGGNTLGGVESSNLGNVLADGILELGHSRGMAGHVVDVGIVTSIPLVEVLVQAIEPIGGGREIGNLLLGHGVWDKLGDRVADEHVGALDGVPEEVPDVGLGRALGGSKITSDLNVRSVEDGAVRGKRLDEGNEARHLRIINLQWLVGFYKEVRLLTMTTSAPPSSGGRRGPPSDSQYRRALSSTQPVMAAFSSREIR